MLIGFNLCWSYEIQLHSIYCWRKIATNILLLWEIYFTVGLIYGIFFSKIKYNSRHFAYMFHPSKAIWGIIIWYFYTVRHITNLSTLVIVLTISFLKLILISWFRIVLISYFYEIFLANKVSILKRKSDLNIKYKIYPDGRCESTPVGSLIFSLVSVIAKWKLKFEFDAPRIYEWGGAQEIHMVDAA